MDRLVFNAAAIVANQAISRQMHTNELANLSTTGFKASYDVAMQSVKTSGSGFDTRYQPQLVEKDLIKMTPGPLMVTGNPLDVAMQNATVLGVQAPNGELAFTRRGDLRVNASGVLETGDGHIVRGENGPITLPPGYSVTINQDGSIYASDPTQAGVQTEQLVGTLMLRDSSSTPLRRREDGLFRVDKLPPGSDIPATQNAPSLISKTLEGSNINAIDAMTKMIFYARTFETQIRVIRDAKEIDSSGASMIRQS